MYTCSVSAAFLTATHALVYYAFPLLGFLIVFFYATPWKIPYFRQNREVLVRNLQRLKQYVTIFAVFVVVKFVLPFVFSESHARQLYAILRSFEPVLYFIPWFMEMKNRRNKLRIFESGVIQPITSYDLNENLLNTRATPKALTPDGQVNYKKVVEYLLKGIYKAEVTSRSTSDLADKNPAKNPIGLAEAALKKLFGCCFEAPDEYEQYEAADSLHCTMIMGYPGVLGDAKITSRKELRKFAKVEHVVTLPLEGLTESFNYVEAYLDQPENQGIRVVCLAPKVFESIRSILEINYDEFLNLFNVSNLSNNGIHLYESKYLIDTKEEYVIKLITMQEYEILKNLLEEIYAHLLMNPKTTIWPILGCYYMEINEGPEMGAYPFIVQKTLSSSFSGLEDGLSQVSWLTFYGLKDKPMSEPSKFVTRRAIVQETSRTQLGISNEQSNSITSQLMEDGRLFIRKGITEYYLGAVIVESAFDSHVQKTMSGFTEAAKGKTPACSLFLQEPHKFNDKECLIFEERKASSRGTYSVKEIYIVVDPVDIESIKEFHTQQADRDYYIINFQSIISYYSVREYVSMVRKVEEGEVSRRDSHYFEFPETNQIVYEDSMSSEHSDTSYAKMSATSLPEVTQQSFSPKRSDNNNEPQELKEYNPVLFP